MSDDLFAAKAYWNQRFAFQDIKDEVIKLYKTVDRPTDLNTYQWAQLISYALEFKPDVILELGRGFGNSTCAFTEAANKIGPQKCKILSLCISTSWDDYTGPRLEKVVPRSWFTPLETFKADILTFDFKKALDGFQKVIVFWDAHGFDVAECILGEILPLIAEKEHMVVIHDLTDVRYNALGYSSYDNKGIWKGETEGDGQHVVIGEMASPFSEAIAITDFAARNKLPVYSAEHSFHLYIGKSPDKMAELQKIMSDFFSLQAHWFWFSLNGIAPPYTFPRFNKLTHEERKLLIRNNTRLMQRVKIAAKVLLNRYPVEKLIYR